MRIVDRKTFLAMPAGTVFSKYKPCIFGDLCIKEDTLATDDFLVQQLVDPIECTGSSDLSFKLEGARLLGESLSMDFDCLGRDGCFDEEQLFAVWERADVEALIGRLQRSLDEAET
jgi:hypothetical protein